MSIFGFSKTIFKNLFNKPATDMYPLKDKIYPENARGKVAIDIDLCIFCGLCARNCPTNAISVSRQEKTWAIERMNCIQCSSCVDNCPKKCMTMNGNYTSPGREKIRDEYHARVSDNL